MKAEIEHILDDGQKIELMKLGSDYRIQLSGDTLLTVCDSDVVRGIKTLGRLYAEWFDRLE